jgi:hypothetical protein
MISGGLVYGKEGGFEPRYLCLVQDLACTSFDVSQHLLFSSQVTHKALGEELT